MPTSYFQNGFQQVNAITWDDRLKWMLTQLGTQNFVLVMDQNTVPVEIINVDPSTGIMSVKDLSALSSHRIPIYTTATLPSAATTGRLVYTTDDGNVKVSNGSVWITLAASAGAGVTASGNLDTNQIVIGGGASVIQKLGTLGTTTTVLHGNAAGAPTFGAVSLTAEVSGTLPIGNGGTGQTTANTALNALLPTQTSNANKVLTTDGSNTSWAAPAGSLTYGVAYALRPFNVPVL